MSSSRYSFSSLGHSPSIGHSTLGHIQNAGQSTLVEVAHTGRKPTHWKKNSTSSLAKATDTSLLRRLSSLKRQSPSVGRASSVIMSMGSYSPTSSVGSSSSPYMSPIKRQNKILARALARDQFKLSR